MTGHVVISPPVVAALEQRAPVVALESTIIAHGMPYPQNLETALALEAAVRSEGAVPATICVQSGKIRVGLNKAEIEHLARAKGVIKVSRHNLSHALQSGSIGATTVAATMICADRAGLRFFATGGIGGVHREVTRSMDISADLTELARTRVAVICSGVKAILDIPKTLEALETLGVPVIGYRTDRFPAFYSRAGGVNGPIRVDDPIEIAQLIKTHGTLGLRSGVLIANPVPPESEIPFSTIEGYVRQALAECDRHGAEVTPFLLRKMTQLSGGSCLRANIALVLDNAKLAARLAVTHAAINTA